MSERKSMKGRVRYIYTYVYRESVCVCERVCVRERQRQVNQDRMNDIIK